MGSLVPGWDTIVFHEPEEEHGPVSGYFNRLAEQRRLRAKAENSQDTIQHSRSLPTTHYLPVESQINPKSPEQMMNHSASQRMSIDWESELDSLRGRSYKSNRESMESNSKTKLERRSWWKDLEHANLN